MTAPADLLRTAAGRAARADYRRFCTIATRWADNDAYGHVNNTVYYSYFDSVVNRYLIESGALDPARGEIIALVAQTGCRYHAPAAYPEDLEVGLAVSHIGNSSVRYELAVFRSGEPAALAEAHFIHVCVDRHGRRPAPMPQALRLAAQAISRQAPRAQNPRTSPSASPATPTARPPT